MKYLTVGLFVILGATFAFPSGAQDRTSTQSTFCPALLRLMESPALVEGVAAANGLSAARFFSLEMPVQRQMIQGFADANGICRQTPAGK